MPWTVNATEEFTVWWHRLGDRDQERVAAAVEVLTEAGPTLGRPLVDTLVGSRHPNMKELRATSRGRALRVLFAFDPRREAILLLGGDKTGGWSRWYRTAIPRADRLLDDHLTRLEEDS